MKIVSWSVNGIVSCRRKGLLKFISATNPDVICLQEIKTKVPFEYSRLPAILEPCEKAGVFGHPDTNQTGALSCSMGMGIDRFDVEGRLIALEFPTYYILNIYTPSLNPHSNPERPAYRRGWDKALKNYVSSLQKPAILCGDFNVIRAFIDSYPENGKNELDDTVFRSEIRESFEQLFSAGLADAFRALYPERKRAYT